MEPSSNSNGLGTNFQCIRYLGSVLWVIPKKAKLLLSQSVPFSPLSLAVVFLLRLIGSMA